MAMSIEHLFNMDTVQYLCSCGTLKPICRVYICRHCLTLRCSNCVSHEVESHFCPNCLENLPSPEAKLKKNRCGNCWNCPSCKHTLNTRATSIQVQSQDDPTKATPKKMYYLACACCRFTSRDVGIKDQSVATGGWGEKENPSSSRISSLAEHYQSLVIHDKIQEEQRRTPKRRSYIHYSDKIRLSAIAARKRAGLPPLEDHKLMLVTPSEAVENVEPLPDNYYTDAPDIFSVTNLEQRLATPEFQPVSTKEMFPQHTQFLIKRSLRCKKCEHTLSKPEWNPSSIRFKIQLNAYYHVPEIRILKPVDLKAEQSCPMILTVRNPTQYDMKISLTPLSQQQLDDLFQNIGVESVIKTVGNLGIESSIITGPVIKPDMKIGGTLNIPSASIPVSPRDDAAEYDDSDPHHFKEKDDPNVVLWRRSNKIAVMASVIPHQTEEDVWVGLVIHYDYMNTVVLTADSKDTHKVQMDVNVLLNLGKIKEQAAQ